MHAAKTGALFAAAAELGAIAAGAPAETCAALGRFGLAIGIAFQHADDRDDAELARARRCRRTRMHVRCVRPAEATRGCPRSTGCGWSVAGSHGSIASRA